MGVPPPSGGEISASILSSLCSAICFPAMPAALLLLLLLLLSPVVVVAEVVVVVLLLLPAKNEAWLRRLHFMPKIAVESLMPHITVHAVSNNHALCSRYKRPVVARNTLTMMLYFRTAPRASLVVFHAFFPPPPALSFSLLPQVVDDITVCVAFLNGWTGGDSADV